MAKRSSAELRRRTGNHHLCLSHLIKVSVGTKHLSRNSCRPPLAADEGIIVAHMQEHGCPDQHQPTKHQGCDKSNTSGNIAFTGRISPCRKTDDKHILSTSTTRRECACCNMNTHQLRIPVRIVHMCSGSNPYEHADQTENIFPLAIHGARPTTYD